MSKENNGTKKKSTKTIRLSALAGICAVSLVALGILTPMLQSQEEVDTAFAETEEVADSSKETDTHTFKTTADMVDFKEVIDDPNHELKHATAYRVSEQIKLNDIMLDVPDNATTCLYIKSGASLDLTSPNHYTPAIHVPANATLVIAIDEHASLFANTGIGHVYNVGEPGGNAHFGTKDNPVWTGAGGKGHNGDNGRAPAIGGKGGAGGAGGAGGNADSFKIGADRKNGNAGKDGTPGRAGENAGIVYFLGRGLIKLDGGEVVDESRQLPDGGVSCNLEGNIFEDTLCCGGGGAGGPSQLSSHDQYYAIGGGSGGYGGGGGGGSGGMLDRSRIFGKEKRGPGGYGGNQGTKSNYMQGEYADWQSDFSGFSGGAGGRLGNNGADGSIKNIFIQDTFSLFIGTRIQTENEKWKEGDYLPSIAAVWAHCDKDKEYGDLSYSSDKAYADGIFTRTLLPVYSTKTDKAGSGTITDFHGVIYDKDFTVNAKQYENNMSVIGEKAFANTKSVEHPVKIEIAEGYKTIGQDAFLGASAFSKIVLPSSIDDIGAGAFTNCTELTEFTIPKGVPALYGNTFAGCSKLTSLTIPETVGTIEGNEFSGSGIEELRIEGKETEVNVYAFDGMKKLKKIYLWKGSTADLNYVGTAQKIYYDDL